MPLQLNATTKVRAKMVERVTRVHFIAFAAALSLYALCNALRGECTRDSLTQSAGVENEIVETAARRMNKWELSGETWLSQLRALYDK